MITSLRAETADLTILTGSGAIDAAAVMNTMNSFYDGTPTRLVLWDLSGADVTGIDFDGVQRIAELAVKLGARRPGGRTAIVTAQQVTFGIGRVYDSLLKGGVEPLLVQVFWTMDEALAFLGLDSLPEE